MPPLSSLPAVPDLISNSTATSSRTPKPSYKRCREPEPLPLPEPEPASKVDGGKPGPFLSPPKSIPTAERATKKRKTHRVRGEAQGQGQGQGQGQHQGQVQGHTGVNTILRPPGFWDNLTYVPLVKCALQELDRRSSQVPALPDLAGRSGPGSGSSLSSVDLGRYARHGGPDLSSLRGVQRDMSADRDRRTPRITGGGGIRKPQGSGEKGTRRGSGRTTNSLGSRNSSQRSVSWTASRHTSSRATATSTTTKTRSTGPYDAAFKQHLVDWKVWPIGHYLETGEEPSPPDNLQDIIRELCYTDPPSLEPLEASTDQDLDFRHFRKAYSQARSEEPRSRTLDCIEGVAMALSSSHVKQGPVKFNNLLPLLPANLVPGNPDRVYGARPEKLDASVRCGLETLILPTTAQDILCPNFIVHVKGPAGEPERANLQAVYDGALAARGMEALWAFGSSSDGDQDQEHDRDQEEQTRSKGQGEGQDGQQPQVPVARTIACTFSDGVLRMYAIHCRSRDVGAGVRFWQQLRQQMTPSWSGDVEFVTTMIGSWLVLDRSEEFHKGAAAFRNGLEWARKQRDEAINRANRRVSRGARVTDILFGQSSLGGGDVTSTPSNSKSTGARTTSQEHRPSSAGSGSGYQSSADPLLSA